MHIVSMLRLTRQLVSKIETRFDVLVIPKLFVETCALVSPIHETRFEHG